jgi:hypothetical protein
LAAATSLVPRRADIGWNQDYDVLEDDVSVGRIFLSPGAVRLGFAEFTR